MKGLCETAIIEESAFIVGGTERRRACVKRATYVCFGKKPKEKKMEPMRLCSSHKNAFLKRNPDYADVVKKIYTLKGRKKTCRK